MAQIALWRLALEVLAPNAEGFSRVVTKVEMIKRHPSLLHTNGCSWGRSDGPLARKYILKRIREGKKVTAYQLCGLRQQPDYKSIRSDIRKAISQRVCVVTGVNPSDTDVARIECDHKNGRYDESRMEEPSEQQLSDFQPLHREVNLIKRSHCKRCSNTGQRFDATIFGFSVGWTKGGLIRPNHELGCIGCYWHDPKDFHAKVSAGFRYVQRQG